MNWKALLVFLGAVALGTGVFLNLNQILNLIQQGTGPLFSWIPPLITQVQKVLGQIPPEWRSIILISAPAALIGFVVNWWRLREQNQQAEKALAKIQELSTANLTATTANQQLQKQMELLQQGPKTVDLSGTVSELQGNLSEAQGLISQQAEQMKSVISENNLLKQTGTIDYVRLLQSALQQNNIPIPQPQTNIIKVVK